MYENFQKTQYEILRSRTLAAYVIRAENLEQNKAFTGPKPQPGLISSALSSVSLGSITPAGASRGRQSPTRDGAQRSSAGADRCLPGRSADLADQDTDLVTIGYVSTDRNLAAKLANAHAHGYIRLGIELRSQANEEAESFLKERLGELKDSLEKSEIAVNDYRRAKGIIPGLMSLDGKETVVLDRVSELSKDLTTAQVERIGLEAQDAADQQPQVRFDARGDGRSGGSSGARQLNSLDADYAAWGKSSSPTIRR